MNENINGTIFNILRFCTSDGSGIRTAVYFKGCPLHCVWCHNPEGLSFKPQLAFDKSKCVECGICAVCRRGCHIFNGKHTVRFSSCDACGECVKKCPAGALNLIGSKASVDEIVAEAVKDKPYYSENGGVTLSGGEVAAQGEFAVLLIKALKEKEINVLVETSGCIHNQITRKIFNLCDGVLLDFKSGDSEILKNFTGLNLSIYFKNLNYLESINKPTVLRCPLIEGVNFTERHILVLAEILESYSCLSSAEILPYHNLGKDKSARIGKNFVSFKIAEKKKIQDFADRLSLKTTKPIKVLF